MHKPPPNALSISSATLLAWLGTASMASLPSCTGSGDEPGDDAQWRIDEPLPSGPICSVDIDEPSPDSIQVFPAGSSVPVNGTAAVGEAVPVPVTTLIYVMDLSGSTNDPGGGCGDDPNGDGSSDTTLDCEIAALTLLHTQATALGTIADTGIAVFASTGATADMIPGMTNNDLLTAPAADLGGPPGPDVIDVLRSAESGGSGTLDLFSPRNVGQLTSFGSGLEAAATIANASTQPEILVVYLSDGLNNQPPAVADVIGDLPSNATVFTFAVGDDASCTNPGSFGSLQDIADATGGTCIPVPDTGSLPGILPGIIMTRLTDLNMSISGTLVGGAPFGPIDIDPIDVVDPVVPPPLNGPVTVNYEHTLDGLAAGTYTVCVEATCTDVLGGAAPEECSTFKINAPPVAKCEDVTVSADAMCQAEADVDAGSFDPDGCPGPLECQADPPGPYALGDTPVTLTCSDGLDTSQCEATVTVIDDTPPVVELEPVSPELWPPNHMYHVISGDQCIASISDNCDGVLDPATAWSVHTATSDEGELATGSGNTCDDMVLDPNDPTLVQLRAERAGPRNGRWYELHFGVEDQANNVTDGTCVVTVPHDQSGDPAIDSGCAFCVGDDCPTQCPSPEPTCG
ncbi:vWA domain-containing protein [Paraliomyxa miuraensis]|uniref:hypothetical protein n=1 Tax=Paraliomyxa miuraensis TaxID=376150 RepID=UPI0022575656|nr:hypothetical protein [Paraliomyxa miuraensis]MCX4245027.1 hypothetical protein [Paraliomyxa miuraensis]